MKDLHDIRELPELMTTAEVAFVLRVDRSTLSRWRSSGSGPRLRGYLRRARGINAMTVIEWLKRAAADNSRKQPSGRFYAVLKAGRSYVTGRTLTKRAAQAWLARERAALAGGIDPRAGRATVRTLLPVWLDERKHSVSAKTYKADAALPRLVPTALGESIGQRGYRSGRSHGR